MNVFHGAQNEKKNLISEKSVSGYIVTLTYRYWKYGFTFTQI